MEQLFDEIETDKLPSLPHVLLLLLDASHSEVISFDELSEAIKKDGALTNRIVKTASSAFYGGQGKELTFERVLLLLGLDTIKTIAMTASVQQFFSRFDAVSTTLLKRVWKSSMICAIGARELARLTGYPYQDEAYMAGLLHNIGQLIFNTNFPEHYPTLFEQAKTKNELLAFELDAFGAHHCEAGAWLIGQWGINNFMADAVRYQSEPLEQLAGAHHLVKILNVASRLSQQDDSDIELCLQAGEQLFDLSRPIISDLAQETLEQVRVAAKSMELDLGQLDSFTGADEDKQISLGDRIRSMALLEGPRRQLEAAEDRSSVLAAASAGLQVLFPAAGLFFFMNNHEGVLKGLSIAHADHPVSQLSLGLQSETSLLTRALNAGQSTDSMQADEDKTVSIIDRQIINLTRQPVMICVPLICQTQKLGVMVMGSERLHDDMLAAKRRLLGQFASDLSARLLTVDQQEKELVEQAQNDHDFYHARAREIVHEVNNPLSIINNYVHILASRLEQGHEAQEELNIIKEELARAGSILLRLPGITEKPVSEDGQELVDINQLLQDQLKLFRSSLFVAKAIEAHVEPDPDVVPLIINRNAMKQVVTNLIKNAAESLPQGGAIRVATRNLVNQNGRQYMGITISDNGPGIPMEVQERLFQPVQTTKGESHAGLGLSIVKSLLDDMDAVISCRSDSRNGTSFEILVPRRTGHES